MDRKSIEKNKEELADLKDDAVAGMKKFGGKVQDSAENIKKFNTTFMEDGVAQFSKKFDSLKTDAIEKANGAVKTIGKDVGHGLKQYNNKVQELADSIPGDFVKNSTRYPWVTISLTLIVGFMLGFLLKPSK